MSNDSNWYGTTFKAWDSKRLGAKPTAEMLSTVHGLGARPGKQALAIAMGLRAVGVTGSQIVIACGAPQLNKLRGYVADALLKRVATPPDALGHQVYKLELTPKGKKRCEATAKRAADAEAAGKAADADKPAKAPKAKAGKKRTSKPAKAVDDTANGTADGLTGIDQPDTADMQASA